MQISFINKKGFTLLEIMIVVAIIGILASIAIIKYQYFQCKTKQSEALTNLNSLYVAFNGYYGAYETYANTINELGWTVVMGTNQRYTYTVTSSNAQSFNVRATANIDRDTVSDIWTVNQSKQIQNLTNDCSDVF